MSKATRTVGRLFATIVVLALPTAACGGGASSSSDQEASREPVATAGSEPSPESEAADGGQPEVADLTIGVLPLVHVAPLYWAIQEGYFEEEGLTVSAATAQGGAAIIPSIVSGDFQVGYSNYVSIMQAEQTGVEDLRIVAENDRAAEDHGVYALSDSDITGPAALEGARIAVNTLNNIGTLGINAVLESDGVDSSTVNFVEVPFPDMAATLERGDVDAVWVVEPFLTGLEANLDVTQVLDLFSGPTEELPVAGWVVTNEFAETNPNTVAAFLNGLEQATADIEEDPNIIAEIVPTYSAVEADVAGQVGLPKFVAEPDATELQRVADLMVETGITEEAIDVQGALLN